MDRKAGALAALLCLACWVSASVVANQAGFSLAWKIVLGAQLFCWATQVIGHGVFEKRSPSV
ncbi:Mpo1-like protein, partial [Salmonella sp. s58078]|uniref:Mpo1-like protein n=1 Tax=Salmonella sp. s58078 TaxID=3159699 RepID=UPI00398158D0